MIEHRSKETAKVLNEIPGKILRWGMYLMSLFVVFIGYFSVELIHFNVKKTIKVSMINEKEIKLDKAMIEKIKFNEINNIYVKGNKLKNKDDFEIIVVNGNEIMIKFHKPFFRNNKEIANIELDQEKSLSEIVIGDTFF
ncbi:hypothetical protein [Tenacibaculum sp. 190524A02b]|uniref:Uncharacterized protein n=2 Tax=Tenacibaculum vairaonense TaxID=3137860 RepID=A0ABM9PK12_9FLAO